MKQFIKTITALAVIIAIAVPAITTAFADYVDWDDIYNIGISGKITTNDRSKTAAGEGILVKFILPDGRVLEDVIGSNGKFHFTHRSEYKNRADLGYDEHGDATSSSEDIGVNAVENVLYGSKTYNEATWFKWNTFDRLLKARIDEWHYDLERKNTFYEGPEDLNKVLTAAKGTHYENLITEWVNKVRQEKEDYAYWQEMQNGNADIPTTDTPAAAETFKDVASTHWANKNIKKVTDLGAFSGYEDGTFRPDNQITHEEFIKVIISLVYNGDVANAPVNAISTNWAEWAKPYLNAAIDTGIVTANDADLVVVNTPITRAEMAKIISRALAYLGEQTNSNDLSAVIADWNTIPDEYKPYITQAYTAGILAGYEDSTFKSANSLTRAEASAVVVKLVDAENLAEISEPVNTVTENVNTIVESTGNIHVIYHLSNQDKELTSKSQFVILNGEVMLPIDSIGGFMYKKSTNTIRATYTELPVSTDGAPADYIVGRDKTKIHAEVPVQVINGTIMIPLSVMSEVMKPETFTWYAD